MRWKLVRRRLSIAAPRVIVRSHMPWPLRWVVLAVLLGFSGALALWAFQTGKELAGLDVEAKDELASLREEVSTLRAEREQALSVANTADSLLKAERTAQEKLASQVRLLEAQNLALKADLGFFERLMPAGRAGGLAVRGLQAVVEAPGHVRYQLLVMQQTGRAPEFQGQYEVVLSGQMDGKAWNLPAVTKPLEFKQYQRVEGVIDFPLDAVIQQIRVRVLDRRGAVQTAELVQL
jgi:hypothetical protein